MSGLTLVFAALSAVAAAENAAPALSSAAPVQEAPAANSGSTASVGAAKMAKITSDSTYYDRKEGLACFRGHVFVNDSEYKMHADRAYVFMDGTNELRRIVALGNVALTNGTKRAYGERASYYRETGMVVLYAGEKGVAEVRDETPKGPQIVRGRKIKFWTGSEQVEVLEAELEAPTQGGLGGLKGMIGK